MMIVSAQVLISSSMHTYIPISTNLERYRLTLLFGASGNTFGYGNGANIWASCQDNRSSTEIYKAVPNVSEKTISSLNQEVSVRIKGRNGVRVRVRV